MGKVSIITPEQKTILACVAKSDYLRQNFYFTGGTALSKFYLQHRYSDDLDFFSESKIDQQIVLTLMTEWSKQYNFRFSSRFVEVVYRFDIMFPNKINFKVDFGFYPYKRVEEGIKYQNLKVDSLRDIATNKLVTINQRTDVKDFVDLYFLLKEKYSFWDLLYSAEVKFKKLDIDRLLLAEDFLKVDDFEMLPKMIIPITLDKLKKFFREKAKELGAKSVEE
jgi:predicted nucleotidyltransferase component of viral defense system